MTDRVASRTVGERVVLEPVTPDLARAIVAGDLSGLNPGQGWPHDDTLDAMGMATTADAAPGWLIVVADQVVGDCGTFGWPNEAGEVEIGYGLAAPFRGQGYGTEAVRAMCIWLFTEAAARVIKADVLADNAASRALLGKLGFYVTGTRDDIVSYAFALRQQGATAQELGEALRG